MADSARKIISASDAAKLISQDILDGHTETLCDYEDSGESSSDDNEKECRRTSDDRGRSSHCRISGNRDGVVIQDPGTECGIANSEDGGEGSSHSGSLVNRDGVVMQDPVTECGVEIKPEMDCDGVDAATCVEASEYNDARPFSSSMGRKRKRMAVSPLQYFATTKAAMGLDQSDSDWSDGTDFEKDEDSSSPSSDKASDSESETPTSLPVVIKEELGKQESSKKSRASTDKTVKDWEDVTHGDFGVTEDHHSFLPPGPCGPAKLPPDTSTPADFFKLFLTKKLVSKIAIAANESIEEKLRSAPLKPHSRLRRWKEITDKEVYLFIGVLLKMGIIRLPHVRDYWSSDWIKRTEFFRQCITRNRFDIIYKAMLSLCDFEKSDKPAKIQPIIENLAKNFRKHFVPYQQLSTCETLIGYKGNVATKRYISTKNIPDWGLHAKTLTDANTGYILNIKMHFSEENATVLSPTTDIPSTFSDLPQPYFGRGYHVFRYSRYSSVKLAENLDEYKTYLTGTLDTNTNGLPLAIRSKNKEHRSLRSGNILLHNSFDKSVTTMISTYYKSTIEVPSSIPSSSGPLEKLALVSDYVQYKESVLDLSERYSSHYEFARRSVSSWRKLFFWLIEVTVTNSYILYKLSRTEKQKTEKISLQGFREELVPGLVHITEYAPKPIRIRPSKRVISRTPLLDRFHSQKRVTGRAKECKYCSKKYDGKRKDTSYYCNTCEHKPGLHPGDCFSNYHLGV